MLFIHLFDLHLFVLSISSSSWCLGRAAAYDCALDFFLTFSTYLLSVFIVQL